MLRDIAEWLYRTPVSETIQSSFWFIRLLQATHLLTAAVVSVSGLMIALRVLGLMRSDETFEAVRQRFAPWFWTGLAVMVTTGILQTLGDPVREFTSTSFWVKMALLLIGIAFTALCGRWLRAAPAAAPSPKTAKIVAAGLVLIWLAIVVLGRMIAYDRALWGSLSLRT